MENSLPAGKKNGIKLFQYINYRSYLADYFAARKERDKSFTYRVFSQAAGFSSPSALKDVIDGRTHLSAKGIQKFSAALGHSQEEASYFALLVAYAKAKSSEEKSLVFKEMLTYENNKSLMGNLNKAHFQYFSAWYNPVIRALVGMPDFKEDPHWIAHAINPSITPRQAKNALALMQNLGLLVRDGQGHLQSRDKVLSTEAEVQSLAVRQFHEQMIELAKESINRIERGKREVSSVTVGVSKKCFEEMKQRIITFRQELMKMVEEDRQPEAIYQLNFQLFPFREKPGA